jgi:hypothetical protein
MDQPDEITILVSNVSDTDKAKKLIEEHIHYPIEKIVAQNNGVVVFVVSGLVVEKAEAYIKELFDKLSTDVVAVHVSPMNAFKRPG